MSEAKRTKKSPVPSKPGKDMITYGMGKDLKSRKGSSDAKQGSLAGKANVVKG